MPSGLRQGFYQNRLPVRLYGLIQLKPLVKRIQSINSGIRLKTLASVGRVVKGVGDREKVLAVHAEPLDVCGAHGLFGRQCISFSVLVCMSLELKGVC